MFHLGSTQELGIYTIHLHNGNEASKCEGGSAYIECPLPAVFVKQVFPNLNANFFVRR